MNVFYSRSSAKNIAMMFPLVVVLAVLPFSGDLRTLSPKFSDPAAIVVLSIIVLIFVVVAWSSWQGLRELLYYRHSPAIAFDSDIMAVRQLGSGRTIAIRYSEISQFFLEETEHRGDIRTHLIVISRNEERLRIDCDALTVSAKELQQMVMEKTPDISYQRERT